MKIEIEEYKYEQLLRDHLKLRAFQIEGVDNWDYYDDAMETYEDLLEEAGLEG